MADASGGDKSQQASPLQGYFDWQVNTLMLAKDLVEPLNADDPWGLRRRREATEQEVRSFSMDAIPEVYQKDPSLSWPPEVMQAITRATPSFTTDHRP